MNKRRRYTAEFKAGVVLEILSGQKSVAQASREYGIKDSLISRWKQEFIERSPQVFEIAPPVDAQQLPAHDGLQVVVLMGLPQQLQIAVEFAL